MAVASATRSAGQSWVYSAISSGEHSVSTAADAVNSMMASVEIRLM